VKQLEVRRHAQRDPDADRLSPEGRAQAEDVGREHARDYAIVYCSPAHRTAETVAWFLRGAGRPLPDHEVVPGLAGKGAGGESPEALGETVRDLLEAVPDGARGLAIGHTPLIERAVHDLTGREIEPLSECEGVLLTLEEEGDVTVEELRLT
jgi:phosphohistidine phosphatase SixA